MKSKFNIFFSFILLAVVIFAAVPKVYVHHLLGHHHELVHLSLNDELTQSDNTQNCNFEKFDTTVLYTEFKFILALLELKEPVQRIFFYQNKFIPKLHYFTSPLRGPPSLA